MSGDRSRNAVSWLIIKQGHLGSSGGIVRTSLRRLVQVVGRLIKQSTSGLVSSRCAKATRIR